MNASLSQNPVKKQDCFTQNLRHSKQYNHTNMLKLELPLMSRKVQLILLCFSLSGEDIPFENYGYTYHLYHQKYT